jgi:hypothetical protein
VADRLKLPAFARGLVENRRRGFHPLNVTLLYGDNWRTPSLQAKLEREAAQVKRLPPYSAQWLTEIGPPMLAIEPRDYAPEVYDFRCVAGCQVRVIDALDASRDCDVAAGRWGVFYDLMGELSDWAARALVSPLDQDAASLAWEHRVYEAGRYTWPRWWSDQRQSEHDRRYVIWLGDTARAVLGRAA